MSPPWTMSGAQVGSPLSFANPLGTIAAATTAGTINGSGMQMENYAASVAPTPDSLTTGAVGQIGAASIGSSSSTALNSPTGDSSLSWMDNDFLANLNLAWI